MILYFNTGKSSFVDTDMKILAGIDEVKSFSFEFERKSAIPFILLRQLFFTLTHLHKSKLIVCQFAGYHAFFPCLFARITGKKSLIVSGGTDCVSYPGIGYGNFHKTLMGKFTKWCFQLASVIAPKHETLYSHKYNYDLNEPSLQGIKAFVPSLKKPVHVIYNGYDPAKWKCIANKKQFSFITLSSMFQLPFQVQLKGIDLILEVAPKFPQCTFTIAGVPDWKKLPIKSSNVKILPPVENNQLPAIFSENQYYLQLSMAEGFPNALCEAMLCECVPIVSNVFSMPEIVADTGYILYKRDVDELTRLIQSVLDQPDLKKGAEARKRIAENYTIERRSRELTDLVKSLLPPTHKS